MKKISGIMRLFNFIIILFILLLVSCNKGRNVAFSDKNYSEMANTLDYSKPQISNLYTHVRFISNKVINITSQNYICYPYTYKGGCTPDENISSVNIFLTINLEKLTLKNTSGFNDSFQCNYFSDGFCSEFEYQTSLGLILNNNFPDEKYKTMADQQIVIKFSLIGNTLITKCQGEKPNNYIRYLFYYSNQVNMFYLRQGKLSSTNRTEDHFVNLNHWGLGLLKMTVYFSNDEALVPNTEIIVAQDGHSIHYQVHNLKTNNSYYKICALSGL